MKKDRPYFVTDIIWLIIGYAFIACFLSLPLLLAMKFFGSLATVKEYWLIVVLACFGVVTFLRQT